MIQKQRFPLVFLFLGVLLFVTACGPSASASGGPPVPALPHTLTRVVSIHMIDILNGWVLCADGSVLRTTDGGLTWVDVTSPNLLALQQHKEEGSLFSDTSHAWIIVLSKMTSISFHTSDGGRTWQAGTLRTNEAPVNTSPSAPPSYQLAAISPQEAWAVENQPGIQTGPMQLYHTTDGGQAWTQAQNPPEASLSTTIPTVSFATQQTGLITGTSATTSKGVVYLTQDGGAHWRDIGVQSPDPAWELDGTHSVQFLNTQDGVFTASYHTFATEGITGIPAGEGFSIFSTHDGGQTWTNAPIVRVGVTGSVGEAPFFNSQQGYALSYVGQVGQLALYTTNDGGQHWNSTPVNLPIQIPSILVGVPDFTSLTTGWALQASLPGAQQAGASQVYPTSLYATVDGAKTWTPVHAHFPSFITPASAY